MSFMKLQSSQSQTGVPDNLNVPMLNRKERENVENRIAYVSVLYTCQQDPMKDPGGQTRDCQ